MNDKKVAILRKNLKLILLELSIETAKGSNPDCYSVIEEVLLELHEELECSQEDPRPTLKLVK